MPQQTNLNVAPYFDDFDAANDYHKVLFKPGYPVQARELTTLQSILQNQIEKFGQHFFKEGAKVIPGNIGYSQIYYCVQLENTYQGVPVSAYADQLVGTKITGQTSGVTAFVDSVLLPEDSERGNLTLYINYLTSSTGNNSTQTFFDGELLTCNEVVTSGLLGNTTIAAGSPLASTLTNAAAATGSSFQIENGVYFIRGNFVNVDRENLLLDQYGTTPSYRIGLFVNEEIVNADLDETLNDNSQGFNNYAAPGADRLRISTSLFKKPLDDFNDDNFILLATVINGVLQTQQKKKKNYGGVFYDDLTDVLARRTFDESGHYFVKPFDITVVNSLNDGLGNGGIFETGQFTPSGTTPTDDLALYKIAPGKAYVKGYEIETLNAKYLDVDKPRTTKTGYVDFYQYPEESESDKDFPFGSCMGSVLPAFDSVAHNKLKYSASKKQYFAMTFSDLIIKHKVKDIDLLQIDTEGYDGELICSIDFNLIRPKFIRYEDKHTDNVYKKKLTNVSSRDTIEYLIKNNYSVSDIDNGYDRLCVCNKVYKSKKIT